MRYRNGEMVNVGDDVIVRNLGPAKVVICFEMEQFAAGYEASDWSSDKKGIMVELENGALVQIEESVGSDGNDEITQVERYIEE